MSDSAVHVVVVPHTHWDREWYQPFQQFRRRLVRLVDRLLDVLEGDPDFRHFHLDGQTIVLEDYLEIRPEREGRLRALIRAGRISVGPWYVLPDELLVSGESLVRNLQIGMRMARRFGATPGIGYMPDQFGHTAQMPQILAGIGCDAAVVWRGVGAEISQTELDWRAPDGTGLFTVYLPHGYSNGRALPEEPAALRARLAEILAELAPFRRIPLALVMNGTDHQEAQAALPAALREAVAGWEGVSAEIAPLADYVRRARAAARTLPIHTGELRSALRAHLLPGVASTRIRQKQRDFLNTSLLERYAEPLAAWSDRLTGKRDLSDFTAWAWKAAVQNHPHDSICGCSVDQVHRDMEYRFDQVELVARQVASQALASVLAATETAAAPRPPDEIALLAAFQPCAAPLGLIDATVHLEGEIPRSCRDGTGQSRPVQARVEPGETVFEAELPPAVLRAHIAALTGRDLLGWVVNGLRAARDGSRLDVSITVDRTPRGNLDIAAEREKLLALLDDPQIDSVRARAATARALRIRTVAPLTPHGLTLLPLQASEAAAPPLEVNGHGARNQWYEITVRDDGSLMVVDRMLGMTLPACNLLADEGDRGDEYNFEPVAGEARLVAPAEVAVEWAGPVSVSLRATFRLALPRRLAEDRRRRCAEVVEIPVTTTYTLYAELQRIDIVTCIDNRAEDHRLRAHFPTPLACDRVQVEQAFCTVARSFGLEPAGGVERPTAAGPHKTFAVLSDGSRGIALFNRGLPEIEGRRTAEGSELALTLLRAVGWLSRGDLEGRSGHAGPGLATPEAQCPGAHRFEYALTTFAGDLASAGIVQRAHAFAHPPLATLGERHAGTIPPDAALLHGDNPHVVVSSVGAAAVPGRTRFRLYNSSDRQQAVTLRFAGSGRIRAVDLLGRPVRRRLSRRKDTAHLRLDPFEIVTIEA